jgi:hypothetical protein
VAAAGAGAHLRPDGPQSDDLLLLGPLIGYFGYGYFSMFGGFVAELYPAAVRATGQGTTYNIGRMAGAVAPYTIGVIASQPGIGIGSRSASRRRSSCCPPRWCSRCRIEADKRWMHSGPIDP